MASTIQSPYTHEQLSVWLRGLLTIAWADGHFDVEEQALIADLTHHEITDSERAQVLEPISSTELAAVLGQKTDAAENFLRMGVMVALADGAYSFCEDEVLYQFCEGLGLDVGILKGLRAALIDDTPEAESNQEPSNSTISIASERPAHSIQQEDASHNLLTPVRDWLDQMEVHDPKLAHFLCRMIPPQCPFERDINLFGRKIAHIPALCKLNPLYEQLVSLRFRALSYLADDCDEDVSPYC